MEKLLLASVTLVAVRVYTPALPGAVSVTLTPLRLVAGLIDPPTGVRVHLTPAASLVVADTLSVWVMASAAVFGEMALTVMTLALMVRVRFAVLDCDGLPESVTCTVNGVAVTAVVGTPETRPAALSDKPAGRAPAASVQVYGLVPPAALSIAE